MAKRILVTGAAGFIGSHLVELCLHHGYEVRAFLRYGSEGSLGNLRWVGSHKNLEIIFGDLRDGKNVERAVEGCSGVLHLGALVSIPYSYDAPQSYFDTNAGGTQHILEAARRYGVQRVVATSTSEVYGSAQQVPMSENHPLNGQSPYAASKIASDQLALSFFRSYGVPATILRPFNTFGPRQSTRAVIPSIITQTLQGVTPLQLGRLDTTRDFTYVADTCSAFLCALEKDGVVGEVMNLGTGFEVSIEDVVECVGSILNKKIDVVTAAERIRPTPSEVTRLCSDNRKAMKLLDWTPRYAGADGFRQAMRLCIEWYSQHAHLDSYHPLEAFK